MKLNKAKFSHYILISVLVFGAIGISSHYGWIIIKGISKYNFEFLLAGYTILLLGKLFTKKGATNS